MMVVDNGYTNPTHRSTLWLSALSVEPNAPCTEKNATYKINHFTYKTYIIKSFTNCSDIIDMS